MESGGEGGSLLSSRVVMLQSIAQQAYCALFCLHANLAGCMTGCCAILYYRWHCVHLLTHGFAHCDDVRHHPLLLKGPHVSCAAKPRLHFISNTHHTSRPHHIVHALQVTWGQQQLQAGWMGGWGDTEGGEAVSRYLGGVVFPMQIRKKGREENK